MCWITLADNARNLTLGRIAVIWGTSPFVECAWPITALRGIIWRSGRLPGYSKVDRATVKEDRLTRQVPNGRQKQDLNIDERCATSFRIYCALSGRPTPKHWVRRPILGLDLGGRPRTRWMLRSEVDATVQCRTHHPSLCLRSTHPNFDKC